MPVQNLALLSGFGTSRVPILVPKVGHLRQKFSFDFTLVNFISKFLEKTNKVRACHFWESAQISLSQNKVFIQNLMNFHLN